MDLFLCDLLYKKQWKSFAVCFQPKYILASSSPKEKGEAIVFVVFVVVVVVFVILEEEGGGRNRLGGKPLAPCTLALFSNAGSTYKKAKKGAIMK